MDDQPKLAERIVFIKNQESDKIFEVVIVKNEREQVLYEDLPMELQCLVDNFNSNEKWNNFKEVLECSVALHAAIAVESSDCRQSIMRASTLNLEE